jgi:hypothetical protein
LWGRQFNNWGGFADAGLRVPLPPPLLLISVRIVSRGCMQAPRCIKDVIEERLFDRWRDLFSELSGQFQETTTLLRAVELITP